MCDAPGRWGPGPRLALGFGLATSAEALTHHRSAPHASSTPPCGPACDQERRSGFRGFTLTKRLISAPDVSSAQLSLCAQLFGGSLPKELNADVVKKPGQKRYILRTLTLDAFLDLNISFPLRPEGSGNMSLGLQVQDLCFLKQNCIRNLKMGSKQSILDPPQ